MCKLKGHGKRCPVTPQRKEAESYRQKVKYYAHKEGKSSKEWLESEKGHEFAQENDPRVLNPNWEKEHAQNLAQLRQSAPQVTMNNNWLAKAKNLEVMKATFPERNERRGVHPERDKHYHTHEDNYQEEITKFNHKSDGELTESEVKALTTYTSSDDFLVINRFLRSSKSDPDMDYATYAQKVYEFKGDVEKDLSEQYSTYKEKEEHVLKTVKNLDTALAGRRKLEEPELTYRSITSDHPISEILKSYEPNSTITFDNYSSTSHALTPTLDFTNLHKSQYLNDTNNVVLSPSNSKNNIIFELQTNAGMSVVNYSDFTHEKEVLLPRGIHFKVVDSYAPNAENPYNFTRYGVNDKYELRENTVIVQLAECDKDGNIISFDETEPIIPDEPESFFAKYHKE